MNPLSNDLVLCVNITVHGLRVLLTINRQNADLKFYNWATAIGTMPRKAKDDDALSHYGENTVWACG